MWPVAAAHLPCVPMVPACSPCMLMALPLSVPVALPASTPMAGAPASGPMAPASAPKGGVDDGSWALPSVSFLLFLEAVHVGSHVALSAYFLTAESWYSNSLPSFPSISVHFSPGLLDFCWYNILKKPW